MEKNLTSLTNDGWKMIGNFLVEDTHFFILQKEEKIIIFDKSNDKQKTRPFVLNLFKEMDKVHFIGDNKSVPLSDEDISMVHRMYYEDHS